MSDELTPEKIALMESLEAIYQPKEIDEVTREVWADSTLLGSRHETVMPARNGITDGSFDSYPIMTAMQFFKNCFDQLINRVGKNGIKVCPVCQSDDTELVDSGNYFHAECNSCGLETRSYLQAEDAIENWNQRPELTVQEYAKLFEKN